MIGTGSPLTMHVIEEQRLLVKRSALGATKREVLLDLLSFVARANRCGETKGASFKLDEDRTSATIAVQSST